MHNSRKRREHGENSKAELIRTWVGNILDEMGKRKALDIDATVIPALRELMDKKYAEGINRAYLLNCITTKNTDFVLRFDGNDRTTIRLARSRRVARPRPRPHLRVVEKIPT